MGKNLHISACSSCSNDSCLTHWQAESTGSSLTAKIPEEQTENLMIHITHSFLPHAYHDFAR